MAIGSVIQKGSHAYVYNEKGAQLRMHSLGSDGSVLGYTATSYTLKKGKHAYTYDEKGAQKSMKSL